MKGMLEKEATIQLSKVLFLPNDKGVNKAYINILLEEDIPVLCINNVKHSQKLIPFKFLHSKDADFWHKKGAWEFFLTGYGLNRLEENARIKADLIKTGKKPAVEPDADEPKSQEEAAFGTIYKTIETLTKEQKVEKLKKDKIVLNNLIETKTKDHMIIADTLTTTTSDTAMVNHTIMKEIEHLADDQAKAFSKDVVIYTNEIVKASTKLLSDNILCGGLMLTIARKSKGTVLQHIIRVYLNGVAFLAYFNNMFSSSSTVMKIRNSFNLKYRKFYQALLPHIDSYNLNLDQVFMGGLREIPSDLFLKWAVGFFIHDIGKAADIEYHEGENAYDRSKVVEHVMVGYHSIMEKTNYPKEAGLIVGYHHEYYGDPEGYGPFREYLQQYKNQNPNAKQNYCITYELEPIMDYDALSYFPSKVLEIIDVYDSLTDPRRVYREPMTMEEALEAMYKEFIIKHRKIDPILFDIFSGFIREKEKEKELN